MSHTSIPTSHIFPGDQFDIHFQARSTETLHAADPVVHDPQQKTIRPAASWADKPTGVAIEDIPADTQVRGTDKGGFGLGILWAVEKDC